MSSTPAEAGRRFRPRLWPTLTALAALAVLLGLGAWQLQRVSWKEALISRAQAQLRQRAIPLPPTGFEVLDYRRVSARGTYLHNAAFAFGLSASGGEPGARLVTPLRLDGGPTILVDRGWLPQRFLPPNVPAGLEPNGLVTIEGVARWRGVPQRTVLTPTDEPSERRWFSWDVAAIEDALGLPLEPLQIVLERSGGPSELPKAQPVTVDFANNHLGYALTWYGLAVVLVVVYTLFSFTQPDIAEP
jgi:surfeit locus 1 family protein